eukprot:scaffold7956_cov32-Tisochrysis_lutea.AAC.6
MYTAPPSSEALWCARGDGRTPPAHISATCTTVPSPITSSWMVHASFMKPPPLCWWFAPPKRRRVRRCISEVSECPVRASKRAAMPSTGKDCHCAAPSPGPPMRSMCTSRW